MAKAPPEKKTPAPPKKPPGKAAPPTPSKAAAPARPDPAKPGKPVPGKPAPGKPPAAKPVNAKPHKPAPAFPKKNQPPTAAAFAARLPLPLGKRFDLARGFLLKQPGVSEDVYFYGPETGWALRYLQGERPLCSLHIYDEQPVGIISLAPGAIAGVDWRALSPLGQKARKQAHGSPTLLWLDVPLEGTGANDFRSILRAKLAAQEEDGADQDQDDSDGPGGDQLESEADPIDRRN